MNAATRRVVGRAIPAPVVLAAWVLVTLPAPLRHRLEARV